MFDFELIDVYNIFNGSDHVYNMFALTLRGIYLFFLYLFKIEDKWHAFFLRNLLAYFNIKMLHYTKSRTVRIRNPAVLIEEFLLYLYKILVQDENKL